MDKQPEWTPKFRLRPPIAVILQGDAAVKKWLQDQKDRTK